MVATRFGCPTCQAILQLGQLPPAGARVRCPHCQTVFDCTGLQNYPYVDAADQVIPPTEPHLQQTILPPTPHTQRIRAKVTNAAPPAPAAGASSRRMPQAAPTSGPSGASSRRMPKPIPTPTPQTIRHSHGTAPTPALSVPQVPDVQPDLEAPSKRKKKLNKRPKAKVRKGNLGLIVGLVIGGGVLLTLVIALPLWLLGGNGWDTKTEPRGNKPASEQKKETERQPSNRSRDQGPPSGFNPLEPTRRPRSPGEM